MKFANKSTSRLTLATVALFCSASFAHALEGKAVFDLWVAQAAKNKATITWDTVAESASDSFSMTGVKVQSPKGDVTTIKTLNFQGLKLTDADTIVFDSFAIGEVVGQPHEGGNFGVAALVATAGDIPFGIWEDGLTLEEKKQRIKLGNFSINGVAIDSPEGKATIDSIAFVGADIPLDWRFDEKEDHPDGPPAAPLTLDTFAISGVTGSSQDLSWSMGSTALKNLFVPTSLDVGVEGWLKIYSSMSINNVKASLGEMPVFSLDQLAGSLEPVDANGTAVSRSTMNGLMVNLKAIPDPQTQAIAAQLGYDKVEASMDGTGSYNLTTGLIEVSDFVMKFKDMFDLSMAYSLTGYTKEVATRINAIQQKVLASGNSQQQMIAILPELENIKVKNLNVGLTDHSLTGKLLDFQGQQMGTTGDQLAAGAPMMIGLGMASLKMPALTDMVTKAVGDFLKNKGTLSIDANPGEPVSILRIVTASQADPTSIPDLIGLSVSAK